MASSDPGYVPALISGGCALACAAIALIQSVRLKRLEVRTQEKIAELSAQSDIEVERMRIAATERAKLLDTAKLDTAPLRDAMQVQWQTIQSLRSQLQKMPEEIKNAKELLEWLRQVQKLAGAVRDEFDSSGYALTPVIRHIAHETRTPCLRLQHRCDAIMSEATSYIHESTPAVKHLRAEIPGLLDLFKQTQEMLTSEKEACLANRVAELGSILYGATAGSELGIQAQVGPPTPSSSQTKTR